eukprot:8937544-Pyramimonas_sp.AAC.1
MDEGQICAHIARFPGKLISKETMSALARLDFTEIRSRELSVTFSPTYGEAPLDRGPEAEDPLEVPEHPWKCDWEEEEGHICERGFQTKRDLLNHMRRVHQ